MTCMRAAWLAVLFATTAHASAVLTTGFGVAGVQARCIILNASTKPVEVDSVTFLNIDGAVRPADSNSCTFPGAISPGLACSVVLTGGGQVRCAVATKGNAKSIRATLELFFSDGTNEVLEAR